MRSGLGDYLDSMQLIPRSVLPLDITPFSFVKLFHHCPEYPHLDILPSNMASQSLSGKVAIVTGGTRGIGRGIALELARRGASVLFTYNSPSSLVLAQSLISEVEKSGVGQLSSIQADCRSCDAPRAVVEAARKAFDGGIDIIVNNAGISEEYYLEDVSYDHFDNIMQTNVRFPIFLVKECLPFLRRGGRIVNMSSVCAREGKF